MGVSEHHIGAWLRPPGQADREVIQGAMLCRGLMYPIWEQRCDSNAYVCRPTNNILEHKNTIFSFQKVYKQCQGIIFTPKMSMWSVLLGLLLSATIAASAKDKSYMNKSCRYTWICNDKGCLGNDIEPFSGTM